MKYNLSINRHYLKCPHCGEDNEFTFTIDPLDEVVNRLEYVCESCNRTYSINGMAVREIAIEKSRFYKSIINNICDDLGIFIYGIGLMVFLCVIMAEAAFSDNGIKRLLTVFVVENIIIVIVAIRIYVFKKRHTIE